VPNYIIRIVSSAAAKEQKLILPKQASDMMIGRCVCVKHYA